MRYPKKPDAIKTIVKDTLYWFEDKKLYVTSLKDPLYMEDKEVLL